MLDPPLPFSGPRVSAKLGGLIHCAFASKLTRRDSRRLLTGFVRLSQHGPIVDISPTGAQRRVMSPMELRDAVNAIHSARRMLAEKLDQHIAEWLNENPAGGPLHVVLEDGNFRDIDLGAVGMLNGEQSHEDAEARAILASMEQFSDRERDIAWRHGWSFVDMIRCAISRCDGSQCGPLKAYRD